MEIVVPMCKMLLENPYGDAQMQGSLRCFIRELCWSGSPSSYSLYSESRINTAFVGIYYVLLILIYWPFAHEITFLNQQ